HWLGQLACLHVEEPGDVLHYERLIEPRLQRVGVGDEALQEFLGIERREDVVDVVAAVLGVEALEMLGHPGRAVQLGERAAAFSGWGAGSVTSAAVAW